MEINTSVQVNKPSTTIKTPAIGSPKKPTSVSVNGAITTKNGVKATNGSTPSASPVKKTVTAVSSQYRIDGLSRFEKELMFSSSRYSKVETIPVKLQASPVKVVKKPSELVSCKPNAVASPKPVVVSSQSALTQIQSNDIKEYVHFSKTPENI